MQYPRYLHGSGARDAHGPQSRVRKRTESEKIHGHIKMTDKHETIPSWDGNPATFITYRRKARRYVEGTKRSERYLCGPRLEGRLAGRAETAVERCRPGWLSDDLGAERLLAFLEWKCARQAVPDVGTNQEERSPQVAAEVLQAAALPRAALTTGQPARKAAANPAPSHGVSSAMASTG